jgi:hypothetical protein
MLVTCAAVVSMAATFAAVPVQAQGPDEKHAPQGVAASATSLADDTYATMVRELGSSGMQNNLDLAVFRTWINQLPGLETSGFYDAQVDVVTRSMTLLWKGGSPLQATIRAEAQRQGISLKVVGVNYDQNDVLEAMNALADQDIRTAGRTLRVTSVLGPTLDNPRLTVFGYYVDRAKMSGDLAVQAESAVRVLTEEVAPGLPVVVQPGQKSVPYVTRSTDVAP